MGESVVDETLDYLASLSEDFTGLIKDTYRCLFKQKINDVQRNLQRLILELGPRGIMRMVGFRKTTGSQDVPWPSPKILLEKFNQPNKILSVEEQQRARGASQLTLGARALSKHAHRCSDGFWGQATGTEINRNENANNIAVKILRECIWINIHRMLQSETIIECRVIQGYGIRWSIDGTFKGFLEPQMEGGHDLKWRH